MAEANMCYPSVSVQNLLLVLGHPTRVIDVWKQPCHPARLDAVGVHDARLAKTAQF